MNYQEMKTSHGVQIEALLAGDYATLLEIMEKDDDSNWESHNKVWRSTGDVPHSLFSSLPNCESCLTQAKLNIFDWDEEAVSWRRKLDLVNNPLIPQRIRSVDVLTCEQLEEFSRLQLLANFPEGDGGSVL